MLDLIQSKSATREMWSDGKRIDGIAVSAFSSSSLGSGTAYKNEFCIIYGNCNKLSDLTLPVWHSSCLFDRIYNPSRRQIQRWNLCILDYCRPIEYQRVDATKHLWLLLRHLLNYKLKFKIRFRIEAGTTCILTTLKVDEIAGNRFLGH